MPKTPARSEPCKKRVGYHLRGRLADLRRINEPATDDEPDGAEVVSFSEYGLGFDYVPAGTFSDQKEAYFRYQLSWGGPSDEFRFFVNPDLTCHRIEYWLLDWFDGAHRVLSGDAEYLLSKVWDHFCDFATNLIPGLRRIGA